MKNRRLPPAASVLPPVRSKGPGQGAEAGAKPSRPSACGHRPLSPAQCQRNHGLLPQGASGHAGASQGCPPMPAPAADLRPGPYSHQTCGQGPTVTTQHRRAHNLPTPAPGLGTRAPHADPLHRRVFSPCDEHPGPETLLLGIDPRGRKTPEHTDTYHGQAWSLTAAGWKLASSPSP